MQITKMADNNGSGTRDQVTWVNSQWLKKCPELFALEDQWLSEIVKATQKFNPSLFEIQISHTLSVLNRGEKFSTWDFRMNYKRLGNEN